MSIRKVTKGLPCGFKGESRFAPFKMNIRLKSGIAKALEALGGLKVAQALTAPEMRAVFTFHRVLPEEEMAGCYNANLAVTPDSFEKLMILLGRSCPILPLEEFMRDCETRPGPYCAITFDDGWEDNHRFAGPILRKHKIPATIFVCTGLIGTRESIPEEQLWLIRQEAISGGTLPDLEHAWTRVLLSPGVASRLDYSQAQRQLKKLPIRHKQSVLAELAQRFGMQSRSRPSLMDWKQVQELAGEGISFGSHTKSHAVLSVENQSGMVAELNESKAVLESHFGAKDFFLAYPNGGYNAEVMQAVESLGYKGAFTVEAGFVGPGVQRQAIPRINIDNTVLNDEANTYSSARAKLHILRRGKSNAADSEAALR